MGKNREDDRKAVCGVFLQWLRGLCALVVGIMAVVAWAVSPMTALADDEASSDGTASHYNVVLVTDASGSMERTDPDNLRFSAISRFMALLSNEGNRVGAVAFGEGVCYSKDLTNYDSMKSKRQFVDELSAVPYQDWTNVGQGLQKAVSILDAGKDPDIPSVIVLLTDGNTTMPTDDALSQSEQTKAQAIEDARNKGYKVYSVSLNADASANSAELEQISSATGGEFREVTNANDLSGVYDMFYRMLFQNKTDKCEDGVIPDNGIVECRFDVASLGVQEANILITGQPSDYVLTDPSGATIAKDALADSTFISDQFVSIKIVDPVPGTWAYRVNGTPGEHVRIDIVRNVDLQAQLSVDGADDDDDADDDGDDGMKDEYAAGDVVKLEVKLTSAGETLDADEYGDFAVELDVVDAGGASDTVQLELGYDGFTGKATLAAKGVYQITARVAGQGYELTSNTLTFNVGNSAPTKVTDLEQTVKLWPFMHNTATVDLSSGATDAQDKTLSYEVESSAFQPNDYTLDGSTLTVSNFSLPQGSFTIRAIDSDGASCTFNVLIKTVNIGLITLIAIAAGVLIVLIIIGVVLYIQLNKRFYGTCMVEQFDYDDPGRYYEPQSIEKNRGRVTLSMFTIDVPGFNTRKSYFQATGKDYVKVIFPKGTAYVGRQPVTKIELRDYPTTVTSSPDARKGIRVSFHSRKRAAGRF